MRTPTVARRIGALFVAGTLVAGVTVLVGTPPAAAERDAAPYGPDDERCAGAPVASSTEVVDGDGGDHAPRFTPTAAGTHRWRAVDSGDAGNEGVATACGGEGAEATVLEFAPTATPTLTLVASPDATTIGGAQLVATVTIADGNDPTGTLTFSLYGPDDDLCSGGSIWTPTIPVTADESTYRAAAFSPAAPGIYRWRASYSGDDANNGLSTPCGAVGASSLVRKAQATLESTPSPGGELPRSLSTEVVLTGAQPTGFLVVVLYGPDDADCVDPFHVWSTAVTDGGTFDVGPVPVELPGTYRWTASYSGDTRNEAAELPCGAPGQVVEVTDPQPEPTTLVADPIIMRLRPPTLSSGRLSAVLTSGGVPVVGETIVFSANGRDLCSAVTDVTGRATCWPSPFAGLLLRAIGEVTATYAGSEGYLPSTDTAGLFE